MATVGKTFVMDDKMALDALLKLELAKYADAVTEIVEQSRAEIKIGIPRWRALKPRARETSFARARDRLETLARRLLRSR
eukprot:3175428-Prymnesium_polylepis.1